MELNKKNIIVTGGASGFGLGIVEKFINNGAKVIIADRNADLAKQEADKLGQSAYSINTDVSNLKSIENLRNEAIKIFGHPDIIVNNAGITHMPDFIENISYEEFEKVLNVNVKSVFLMSKAFVPEMKKRKSGVILNIASTAGISPRPRLTWYNATKGWMITATKSLAVELAPFKIRVNAINPVAGETPLLKTFMGEDTPEIRQKFLSTIPLGRFSTPEDMGNAAVFLCSEKASMITGVALEVDGGRCI
tara:strand:+ start:12588 stop:13334 length:747 start_codon:yes stop_codon:yes gene_type:complete